MHHSPDELALVTHFGTGSYSILLTSRLWIEDIHEMLYIIFGHPSENNFPNNVSTLEIHFKLLER